MTEKNGKAHSPKGTVTHQYIGVMHAPGNAMTVANDDGFTNTHLQKPSPALSIIAHLRQLSYDYKSYQVVLYVFFSSVRLGHGGDSPECIDILLATLLIYFHVCDLASLM